MKENWIKLHRKLTDSAVFSDANCLKAWIYILCNVAYRDHDTIYRGEVVHLQAGQMITGRKILANELDISEKQTYKLLKTLEKLGNISIKADNRFSLITVVNWGFYQSDDEKRDSRGYSRSTAEGTTEGQLKDNRGTTEGHNKRKVRKKEGKEGIESKESSSSGGDDFVENFVENFFDEETDDFDEPQKFKGSVWLTERQLCELLEIMPIEVFDEYVERLDRFIQTKKATVKNHAETILKWYNEDRKK